MNMVRPLLVVLCLSVLVSCASKPPRGAAKTKAYLQEGNYEKAFSRVERTIIRKGKKAPKYIKWFTKDYPQSLPHIYEFYKKQIQAENEKLKFFDIPRRISGVRDQGLLSSDHYSSLVQLQNTTASQKNKSNLIDFLLNDNYSVFQSLSERVNQEIIFRRSVDYLATKPSHSLVGKVLDEVRRSGMGSAEYVYLRETLPKIKLPRARLKEEFLSLYPNQISPRLAKYNIEIKLEGTPSGDDIFFEIEEYLRQNEQVNIVESAAPDTFIISLRKLRFRERDIPDRVQTVTYAQHEVNLLSAALLMPRNASYIYDRNTGGFEIFYTFLMKVHKGNKNIIEYKIEGKQSQTYSYCSNARIQNVFGGVSSAGFVANSDMQSRCSSNSRTSDPEAVYSASIEAIGREILHQKPISDRLIYGVD